MMYVVSFAVKYVWRLGDWDWELVASSRQLEAQRRTSTPAPSGSLRVFKHDLFSKSFTGINF